MRILISVLAIALLAACGLPSAEAQAQANVEGSANAESADAPVALIGAWERFIPNREAPVAYEVIEFFDNGWMIIHNAQGGLNAQYTDDEDSFTLSGPLAVFWRGEIAYAIDGAALTLDMPSAGALRRSEWTRVEREAFFKLAEAAGDVVPEEAPAFLAAATASVARDWRPDAVPVSLFAQRLPSGDFALTVEFASPSSGEGLQVIIGRWGFVASERPDSRGADHALPTEFADIPALRESLAANGNTSPLVSANLAMWSKGPVWTVTTMDATGRQIRADYSALNGAPIVPEEPPTMSEDEYVAAYNAQWEAISESFARRRQAAGGGDSPWDSGGGTYGGSGSTASEPAGGGCAYTSHAACNAAAAGDLWGADRIENGTSSQSEEDWYD